MPKPLANVNFTHEEVPYPSLEYQRVVGAWLNALDFFGRQGVDLSRDPIGILNAYSPAQAVAGVALLNEALGSSWADVFVPRLAEDDSFYDSGEWT